jgi:hypothetical protein
MSGVNNEHPEIIFVPITDDGPLPDFHQSMKALAGVVARALARRHHRQEAESLAGEKA